MRFFKRFTILFKHCKDGEFMAILHSFFNPLTDNSYQDSNWEGLRKEPESATNNQ
jgi:hypothetical protein